MLKEAVTILSVIVKGRDLAVGDTVVLPAYRLGRCGLRAEIVTLDGGDGHTRHGWVKIVATGSRSPQTFSGGQDYTVIAGPTLTAARRDPSRVQPDGFTWRWIGSPEPPVVVIPGKVSLPDFNPRNYTIEEKFGVRPGEDWLAVYQAAPFRIGQRVRFDNGHTRQAGVVLDIRRNDHHTHDYEFQVQYDDKPVPRWTLRQWCYDE